MATAERFSLFPLSFVHAGGTLNLAQLGGFNINTGIRSNEIIPGGAVDRARVGVTSAEPVMSFTTMDLATFFGAVSATAGLAATGAVTFRLQERSTGGTFETGTTHETYTAGSGSVMRPVTLSAGQDDDGAVLSSEILPMSSDGITAPIAHNTGVDFSSAPAPAFASRYYLGPVYHDGNEIGGITNVNIDFGINFEPKRFDGDPYARLVPIVTRQPLLTFTTAKIDGPSLSDIFSESITNDFSFYFWNDVANSTRTAKTGGGNETHVEISGTAGKWCEDNITVQGTDDGAMTVQIMPIGAIAIDITAFIDGSV